MISSPVVQVFTGKKARRVQSRAHRLAAPFHRGGLQWRALLRHLRLGNRLAHVGSSPTNHWDRKYPLHVHRPRLQKPAQTGFLGSDPETLHDPLLHTDIPLRHGHRDDHVRHSRAFSCSAFRRGSLARDVIPSDARDVLLRFRGLDSRGKTRIPTRLPRSTPHSTALLRRRGLLFRRCPLPAAAQSGQGAHSQRRGLGRRPTPTSHRRTMTK